MKDHDDQGDCLLPHFDRGSMRVAQLHDWDTVYWVVWVMAFWLFGAIKLWGSVLATWSWWWMLLPVVPWLGYAVHRLFI
jgi:fatty acid desaturase